MRFKVFTWDRLAIYGGMVLATTLASIKAFTFNAALPFIASALLVVVPLCMAAIAGILFYLRWKWASKISFTTIEGVMVMDGGHGEHNGDICDAIARTRGFWIAKFPDKADDIKKYFEGSSLTFVDAEFVEYQAPSTTGWSTQKAVGLTQGQMVTVTWRKSDPWSRVEALIEHEFSHVALNGANYVDDHHKKMTEVKFGMK